MGVVPRLIYQINYYLKKFDIPGETYILIDYALIKSLFHNYTFFIYNLNQFLFLMYAIMNKSGY